MLKIEEEMQLFFMKEKDKKEKEVLNKNTQEKMEPIKIGAPSDDNNKNENNINNNSITNMKIPFAYIADIASGSPAEEAGLMPNDGIINFDHKIFYGSFGNPLKKLAEIVKEKINANIYVEILRIIKDNEGFDKIQYEKINLIPHTWSGQGVLG
jgi:C-terminal processing protease CtpA/Prc